MLTIICWTIISIFGLLYLSCIIGTLATVKDEGKNAYILLTTLFFCNHMYISSNGFIFTFNCIKNMANYI